MDSMYKVIVEVVYFHKLTIQIIYQLCIMHGTRIVASGMPEGLYITNLLAIKLSVHIYKFCLPFELVYANVSCNCNECTRMSVLFLLLIAG